MIFKPDSFWLFLYLQNFAKVNLATVKYKMQHTSCMAHIPSKLLILLPFSFKINSEVSSDNPLILLSRLFSNTNSTSHWVCPSQDKNIPRNLQNSWAGNVSISLIFAPDSVKSLISSEDSVKYWQNSCYLENFCLQSFLPRHQCWVFHWIVLWLSLSLQHQHSCHPLPVKL